MNFNKYAQYYDMLYASKDYRSEVYYIDKLIKNWETMQSRRIIDVGCGTGKHDTYLKELGYNVIGIEPSKEMLEYARLRNPDVDFFEGTAQSIGYNNEFDVSLSLFHVMNYHTSNFELEAAIKKTSEHLIKGGLFIFDFWYGPAVLSDNPQEKEIFLENDLISITRKTKPEFRINENVVNVNFYVTIHDKVSGEIKKFNELHRMRYLFYPEIEMVLNRHNFEVVKCGKWLDENKALSRDSWYGVIVAKKK